MSRKKVDIGMKSQFFGANCIFDNQSTVDFL